MKRFISFISVVVCLAVVLAMAPAAFAEGNSLKLGNNVLTLGVVHNYTVEANGTLELRFHEVYYGKNGGVHEGNLHYWLDFLVNGTAVDKFTTEMEVSAGDVITVQMVSRDGDDSYKAQLYLTFTPGTDEEENTQPQLVVGSAEAQPGDEVVLTVSVVNNPGFTNGNITVTYDETGLELVDFNYEDAPEGFLFLDRIDTATMNFATAVDYEQDALFFAIVLKVKDEAAEGKYEVSLTINLFKNDAEEDLEMTVVPGAVTLHTCVAGEPVRENEVEATCTTDGSYDEVVYCTGCGAELSRTTVVVEATGHEMGQWYVYRASTAKVKGEMRRDCAHCDHYESMPLPYLGDVNGDDKVDTTDAKLIMQYDLSLISEDDLDLTVADVNGDGAVDTTDAKLIMQYDLGLVEDLDG